jgi:ABC-type iron transport system FetAB ATPase subunit
MSIDCSEIVDHSITDLDEIMERLDDLTHKEIEEILSQRRRHGNPSFAWLMWQNALCMRHAATVERID